MNKPKESDWKLFRSMLEELRDNYLAKKNIEITNMLSDPDKTATEQFWDSLELMQQEKKILMECLDGFSRSSMWMKILGMYQCGMMTDKELNRFSDELQLSIREFASL